MKHLIFLILTILVTSFSSAQVGINTTSPDTSAALDVQFQTGSPKGMLTPRMTTLQRTAIASPANGLLVFDTDLKSFYYNEGTSLAPVWVKINSNAGTRTNFKRIKSISDLAAEKTAGGGTKYLLNTNTYYEINGTIGLDAPIDLNNAYLVGLDANEDKLVKTSGNLFEGATGGTIKNLTIATPGGTLFNLNGANTETLLFRDCIVANCTSVGTIQGFGFIFFGVVQYSGNTTGITYTNITRLLLSNIAWLENNTGTFEKYTGTFSLIQKQGGFSEVNGSAIGFDVSANPLTITGDAVLESVVFTGDNPSGYVKGNTIGILFTGYNFNRDWNVRSSGIPTETDANASGDFGVDYAVGSGIGINVNNTTTKFKIAGVSESTNLFRFTSDDASKLTYVGKKKRIFQISGAISFQVPAAGTYIVFLAKNGIMLDKNKVYGRGTAASDIVVLPLNGSTEMKTNDYIEVYIQRYSGSNGTVVVPNMSLTIK